MTDLGATNPNPPRPRGLSDVLDASASKAALDEPVNLSGRAVEVEIHRLGGGRSNVQCTVRNVSASGISLVHNGFVNAGSGVEIRCTRAGRSDLVLSGTVVHCRHLEGVAHVLGIALNALVAPTEREPQPAPSPSMVGGNDDSVGRQLRGDILHMTSSHAEAKLMRHHLRDTHVQITTVDSEGSLLDRLRQSVYDALFIEIDSLSVEPIALIRRVRERNYPGRIVVLTADSLLGARRLRAAGVDDLVRKPFAVGTLHALLLEALERVGLSLAGGEIPSLLAADPAAGPILEAFTHETRRAVLALDHAVMSGDFEAARIICVQLKGAGASFGYPVISDRATDALQQLDATGSATQAIRQLRQLSLVCSRIIAPSSSAA